MGHVSVTNAVKDQNPLPTRSESLACIVAELFPLMNSSHSSSAARSLKTRNPDFVPPHFRRVWNLRRAKLLIGSPIPP